MRTEILGGVTTFLTMAYIVFVNPAVLAQAGMDFGSVMLDPTLKLYLFGTPGQDRFGFMWDDVTEGALGALVVVDSRRLEDCFPAVDYFERRTMPFAVAVNRFFSSVIRIQADRGHHLVTHGPYRFVRHPAYAAAPFLFGGGGLALGSWLAALLGLIMFLPLLRRTAQEDRVLREQLEGYAAYAEKVRYRLFPGVW